MRSHTKQKPTESGIAIVTTLLLTLLLSILVAAMLSASTSDVLISGNEVRTNQVFYIAEAGIHRASGWFSSKFGVDPSSGLFVLPEQNASNTAGVAEKISYTDSPYYEKGSGTAYEQTLPTSVKVSVSGTLKNVVLSGDSSVTYPTSYHVTANDANGISHVYTYNGVVTDFASHLTNQTEGDGTFSVKATLVSIIPPSASQPQGTVTWLLESTGKISRGNNVDMASATIYAYVSARAVPLTRTVVVTVPSTTVNVSPGVIGRGMLTWNSTSMWIDSYKSSLGRYLASLTANTFSGQIGPYNKGSRGDIRTNDETFAGVNNNLPGYIDIKNGAVTGGAYATLPVAPAGQTDPITAINISDGQATPQNWTDAQKHYSQNALIFPPIANPTPPASGAPDYSWTQNKTGTLPAGNYKNISITKGTFTVPPGNYGTIDMSNSQGTIVLGVPGQSTTYNLQGFVSGAQAGIVYRGPVTINVMNSLDVGGSSDVANSTVPPASIRWNFVGGAGQQVYVGGNGPVIGVFYAPNNDLQIRGTGDFYGSIAARSVDIRGSGAIHIDEDAISGVQTTVNNSSSTTTVVGYTATNYSLWRITQAIN